MASFRKKSSGWEAQIAKHGIRKSKVFATKAEAQHWAATTEAEILNLAKAGYSNKTFGDVLSEYSLKVSPTKKGCDKEQIRIAMYLRDEIAKVQLKDLSETHFADWRDRRLKTNKAGSVLRDWTLLNNAINVAIKEWKWLPSNPMANVRRPQNPEARTRIVTPEEIEKMSIALGDDVRFIGGRVCYAMQFALETAMRAGEIVGLRPETCFLEKRIVKVLDGKNRSARRTVPLSKRAVEILKIVDCNFNLTSAQLDVHFRKAKDSAGVDGFTFHDLRHNAITRLSKKVDVLALARIVGHGNIKELLLYYNPDVATMAGLLD